MSDEPALTGLIEEAIDHGATTVEEIHREIADMPLGVLDRLGWMEDTTREVRRIQDASIGGVYELIRTVNHKVARLAADLLEELPPADAAAPADADTSRDA